MATTSNKSSGTQINQRGVTQGNTLVDPVTGLPVAVISDTNGVKRLAVDAAITLDTVVVDIGDLTPDKDQVSIGDKVTGNNLKIQADGSIDVNAKLDASDGDNVAISDGTNTLAVNTDGSINVNVDAFSATPDNTLMVGSEDGTKTGTKHAAVIDSDKNLHVMNMGQLVPNIFDAIAVTYPSVSQEAYTYKLGGVAGVTVATVTVTYTDATKTILTSVART